METEKHLTSDDIEHLPESERMMKLEMYTGSKKQKPREEWIYDIENDVVRKEIITTPECTERCFLEPISNAADNVGRSRRFGVDPGDMYVYMSPTQLVIENYGTPIPVEYKEENEMYVPELIFGVPGSSSHYNEGIRHEAGVNGLGVKLTNIFSKHFKLEIEDHIQHKSYSQVWVGTGLDGREECDIHPFDGKTSRVRVTFDLDYAHFKYEPAEAPLEIFELFVRHCADISYTTKIPVRVVLDLPGGEHKEMTFDLSNPRDYAKLYFGDAVENSILHYEWPKGTRVKKSESGEQTTADPNVIPLVEMCVIDTPDTGTNISFVNSMMTRDGGCHVEAAIKPVSNHIVNVVHSLTDGEGGTISVNLSHVRPNISMILSCRVQDPGFSGQTKNKLVDPNPFVPKIRISKEEMEPVKEWNIIQNLQAILEAKKNALLSKTDGKKRKNIALKFGIDANDAGGKKSDKCTLYIVEGLSASSYPKKLIDCMENGPDHCGILPIRGKFLNVMNARSDKVLKNAEICELKRMLGLAEKTDYSKPENFKKLRYGKVVIMADSDDDGKHIVALLLLYFHHYFKELLKIGYVYNYLTPIIRVVKGKRKHKFYTHAEYERWKNRTKTYKTWKHMYFKGLGRATDPQIKEDYEDQHVIHCIYDKFASHTINLAFSKKLKDERKAWLSHFGKALDADVVIGDRNISEFLNTELVKFGLLSLSRAIPRFSDGLKDAQRKALWGAFKIWDSEKMGKIKIGNTKFQELKVDRFAAEAAGKTNYHHGDRSLQMTIMGMAQDFAGANNLPYFKREGQFGTRDQGGRDAASPRYAETCPEDWLPYVFRVEDIPILDIKEDEGQPVDPVTFYPILPMHLINGCQGIATAYSTFIPNHNPLDVSGWYKCRIQGKELPKFKPRYKGFCGDIEIIDRRDTKRKRRRRGMTPLNIEEPASKPEPPSVEEPAQEAGGAPSAEETPSAGVSEDVPIPTEDVKEADDTIPDYMEELNEHVRKYKEERGRPLYSMVTTGEYFVNGKGQVVITELPIGRWTYPYKKWLEKLRDEHKLIKDIRNTSKSDFPGFELTGFKPVLSIKSLNLKTQFGMSNMWLLDDKGVPQRFDSIQDILEAFYIQRLEIYKKRREYLLRSWRSDIPLLHEKRRFIKAVVDDKTIVVQDRPRAEVHEQMDALGLDRGLLSSTSLAKLTTEEIQVLDDKIHTLEETIRNMEETTPEQMYLKEIQQFEKEYRRQHRIASKGDKIKLKVFPKPI